MRKHELGSDDARWEALIARATDVGDPFVYAVVTTGVYCRAGCASRRPRRENVKFFDDVDFARRSGFRPCKRCTPDDPSGSSAAERKVILACRYIEKQGGRAPTLEELGREVGMSPTHLQRVFKRIVGISPRKFADALRVERLKGQLQQGETVAMATYGSGYGSSSRLYENSNAQLGMTPQSYRDGALGETIQYLTVRSPIGGSLLVAATSRGVCAVRLGDVARELVSELKKEFPAATLERGDAKLRRSLEHLTEYLAGKGAVPDLPYDVQATAFQRSVWEAIRSIPAGHTATYGDLAKMIGKPTAVRAVAAACARNQVALLIPCHRVVPARGGPGQYRWGAERKRRLLSLEK